MIGSYIHSTLSQVAVYWGNPVKDGYGKFTYDPPVEIPCRWEGKQQVLKMGDAKGDFFEYIGMVYVDRDLVVDGCLYLGRLSDLSAEAMVDPYLHENVYPIKQFEKVPAMRSTTEFLRKAYVTLWQYR